MTSSEPTQDVVALVLTHDRPRLATDVVRALVEAEGVPPDRVILVVNGEGGLLDMDLERRIVVERLEENVGPAGGFHAGISVFLQEFSERWLYVAEDDVGLFSLPPDHVSSVQARASQWIDENPDERLGGVVAYGRDLNPKTGITKVHEPRRSAGLEPVDVAPWGASLVSRSALEAGAAPQPDWFFGYEDFDFWLDVRQRGFQLLLDSETAVKLNERAFGGGRESAFESERPSDIEEPWRAYYTARNFLYLARRHGHGGWIVWHLLKSVRRWQLSPGAAGRRAIVRGLADGFLGVKGRNDKFVRLVGEY